MFVSAFVWVCGSCVLMSVFGERGCVLVSEVMNNHPPPWKPVGFCFCIPDDIKQHCCHHYLWDVFLFTKKMCFLFSKFRRKLTVKKKTFVLSSGSCCFDREPRSRRDCWALFFHSKMLPLDKTSCVCSRHGAAVNTPAVYLLHIFLWLDYCCGTNILASGFKIFGSTKAVLAADVWGMMSLYCVRVDYTWFIKLVFEILRRCCHPGVFILRQTAKCVEVIAYHHLKDVRF